MRPGNDSELNCMDSYLVFCTPRISSGRAHWSSDVNGEIHAPRIDFAMLIFLKKKDIHNADPFPDVEART